MGKSSILEAANLISRMGHEPSSELVGEKGNFDAKLLARHGQEHFALMATLGTGPDAWDIGLTSKFKDGWWQSNAAIGPRDAEQPSCKVVIGAARRSREAWVLNAFEPKTEPEKTKKARLDNELTFNVTKDAHRLSGKRGEPRNSKYVLACLTDESLEREVEALSERSLDELRERGMETYLTEFLEEVGKLLEIFPGPRSQTGTQSP